MPSGARSAELARLLALLVAACQEPAKAEPRRHAVTAGTASASASVSTLPRAAGAFHCSGDQCVQHHPRLPDTGEWICADHGGVVWCAGGDDAAGVVSGPPDPSYRCGPRWGAPAGQRICLDRQPDYPPATGDYSCRFEQERGVARVCRPGLQAPGRRPLAAGALPACYVDQDCPSRRCDRGSCVCASNADCTLGSCSGGSCVEVPP